MDKQNQTVPRETLTIVEAANRLGIGRNQAYEAAASGQLPTIRIGKRILVPVVALNRMLAGEKTNRAKMAGAAE
jgi:excisionase family DNA binding protein